MLNTVILTLFSLIFIKRALHLFQQNRYEFFRYTEYLTNKKNYKFEINIIFILLMIILGIINVSYYVSLIITVLYCILEWYLESKKNYIKPLVYTKRVIRQIIIMIILTFVCEYLLLKVLNVSLVSAISVVLPYLLVYPMALLALPMEKLIKKSYENKAKKILYSYTNLIKVGITGSFGKTSTKNIINDIVNDDYYTLITPASYNTPMGITRTIREYLKPTHELFICEMGADHVGEITYLMNFVKPKYGIVTSIGPQHLNTFKSLDNIINEKMQEIELLPSDGVGIINYDNEYIRNYKIKNNCKVISIGIDNKDADYVAYDLNYSSSGTTFKVNINDKPYEFKTILLGKHNVMNILSGIVLALELNIDVNKIVSNVSNVRMVEHRLELKKINGFTFIDNAFNSNPVSSKLSLDVLSKMDNKRIIVTPGLIDLGKKQDEYNYEFGKYMINKCDFVILVGKKNTETIYNGLKDVNYDMHNVLVVESEKEAFNYVYTHFTPNDIVLLENDLPDAFLN